MIYWITLFSPKDVSYSGQSNKSPFTANDFVKYFSSREEHLQTMKSEQA